MGLSNSFTSLGRIAGPLLGGYVFDINIVLPYLIGVGIMGVGFVVSLLVLREGSTK
jgi:DHA1 family multidrug resistance protein-like MFS transporter